MKKLLICLLLILGCEGILSPEFHLAHRWEYLLQKQTNTETGEVEYIEPSLMTSPSILIFNRNGTYDWYSPFGQDSHRVALPGHPFYFRNGRWFVDGNQLTFYFVSAPSSFTYLSDEDSLEFVTSYSISGDTLLLSPIYNRPSKIYSENYYIRLD